MAMLAESKVMVEKDVLHDVASWTLLPPGNLAFLRFPVKEVPAGCRIATPAELLVANLGYPFPWGTLPEDTHASRLWKEHRIGIGGLVHEKWFITTGGRFGGAANVPTKLPGSLRCCMLLDGGTCPGGQSVAENEGYAVVKETTGKNLQMYRRVQLHAAEHVSADGGAITVSPIASNDSTVYVGFVGRCLSCPNPELISIKQLRFSVAGFNFQLLPEWQNWTL